jgi:hypothetical protein
MTCIDTFLVVEVYPIKANTWLVRGRAYEDIQLGDVVFAKQPMPASSEAVNPFRVVAISSYGGELDVLGRMMTGDLTVRGDDGDQLKSSKMLLRCPEPADRGERPVVRTSGSM